MDGVHILRLTIPISNDPKLDGSTFIPNASLDSSLPASDGGDD
jgi:hypothetical protein